MSDAAQQMIDMWKRQMEEGTQAWLKMLGQGSPPAVDPTAFWRPFMDPTMAAWSRMMSQGPASPDLLAQWKQFLDQWIAAWARVLEQSMGTEAFARALGKQLEGFLNVASPAKKAAEQYVEQTLGGLGLPSRSQLVSLAGQVVGLEEKVEALEDRLSAVLRGLDEIKAALRKEPR
ncbi:MAG: hypothetical protein L0027_11860 [Candidatus Rokubacteria bacterium]|nr:hypothetical protein [Candidatus Rokubacteria bacterium]